MSIPRLLTTALRARPYLVSSLHARQQCRRITTVISAPALDLLPPDLPAASPAPKKTRAKSTATKAKAVKAAKVDADDILAPPKAVRKTAAKSTTAKSAPTKTTRTRKAAVVAPSDVDIPAEKAPVKRRASRKSTVAANETVATAADSIVAASAVEAPQLSEQSQVLEPVMSGNTSSQTQAETTNPEPIPANSSAPMSSAKIVEPQSVKIESPEAKTAPLLAAKKVVAPKTAPLAATKKVLAPTKAAPTTSRTQPQASTDKNNSGFEVVDDDAGDTPEVRLRRGQAASEHVAMGGKLPKRYKGAARRVLAIIVALPFVIVGTPLVYERVIEGKGPKKRPVSQFLAAQQTADGAVLAETSSTVAESTNV